MAKLKMNTENKKSDSGLLQSSFAVSVATLMSRILGLVRVRLEALVLGGGDIASGWFIAFAIPNLLRRILGEGSLGQAVQPIVSELDLHKGRDQVKKELGVIFAVLGALLSLIVILVSALALMLGKIEFFQNISFFSTPRMRFVLELLPILMPYGLFMCLVGVAGCVLNYLRVFFLPALGALLLNIFLLSGLSAAFFLHIRDVEKLIHVLAYLVLISGFVQLLFMFFLLKKNNCLPVLKGCISFSSIKSDTVKKLFSNALPGMIGGIAVQISFLVDRMLAVSLGSQAVPALTFVDRLIDIPIGIIAVSLSTVLMSSLTYHATQENMESFARDLDFGIRYVFFICLPIAVGVIFLYNPLMSVLCLGGRYTVQDLQAAEMVAVFYGAGIPVFCLLKVLLPAFYSRKKMKTTFYASLCAIVLNIVLNLILMHPMKQAGIALATVISSVVNCSILLFLLKKENILCTVWNPVKTLARSLAFAFLSIGAVTVIVPQSRNIITNWNQAVILLAVCGTLFVAVYFILSAVAKAPEIEELLSKLKRRKG